MAKEPMTPSEDWMTDGQIDKATEVFRSVLRTRRARIGSTSAQHLLESRKLRAHLSDGITAMLRLVDHSLKPETLYALESDKRRSFSEHIAAGKYAWTHGITEKDFKPDLSLFGKETIHACLVPFGEAMSPIIAYSALRDAGRHPANLEALLLFGEKYPAEQLVGPIIALRDFIVHEGVACFPYLGCDEAGRSLSVIPATRVMQSRARMLADM